MQALILFALFGFFTAAVGGLVAWVSQTTQALRLAQIAQTGQMFDNISTLMLKLRVREDMQSPAPASGSTQPAGTYLCNINEVRQVVDCTSGTPRDAWGRAITGTVLRTTQVLMTDGNLMFNVPVTVYALLSPGPDGVANTTIPASPSQATDLTRLSAAGDDILRVFSDLPAQQQNAASIEDVLNNVALAAQRQYQQQFYQFQANIGGAYNASVITNGSSLYDIQSAKVVNNWKSMAGAPDFHHLLGSDGNLNTYNLGADGDVARLERVLPSGGQMLLNATIGNSDAANGGVNDLLMLYLTLSNTVWHQAVAANCNSTTPINCMKVVGSTGS